MDHQKRSAGIGRPLFRDGKLYKQMCCKILRSRGINVAILQGKRYNIK